MIKKREGTVTVFLALSMFSFLTLCLVLIEGMRNYYIRTKAMQSIELTEFSVLSEFQKELFGLPPMTSSLDIDRCMEQKINAVRKK